MRPRWMMFTGGALMALLGAAYLFVMFVLPRLLAASERAQGVGLYDPALGGDPLLAGPRGVAAWTRVAVAVLLLIAGTVLSTSALRRRGSEAPR